ncbi:MAG: cytochrome c [Deltaproteobacteria bacterium]|nr:cytochrome c [Deltaproteobacteria bacterium]
MRLRTWLPLGALFAAGLGAGVLFTTFGPLGGSDGAAMAADGENGAQLYDDKCIVCHTIGKGIRKGPDLKDVHKRRDKAWLVKWIKDPEGMSKSDPTAKELLEQFKNTDLMVNLNLRDDEVEDLLEYIRQESEKAAK